jgi:hypothetical protein
VCRQFSALAAEALGQAAQRAAQASSFRRLRVGQLRCRAGHLVEDGGWAFTG